MLAWIDSLPLLPATAFLLVVIYARAGGTYALGRAASHVAGRGKLRDLAESPRVTRAVAVINRYGAPIVALSFLTIGFQTACNLAAGVTRMPLKRYLPALLVGGFAWALLYATVGLAAISLWWEVALRSPWFGALLAVAFVGLLTVFILRRRAERVREQRASRTED